MLLSYYVFFFFFSSNGLLVPLSLLLCFFLGTERNMGFVVNKRGFLAPLPPLVLALLFVQRFTVVVSALNYTNYRQVSGMRLERIQRHLDKINKPPVMTIEVYITYLAS